MSKRKPAWPKSLQQYGFQVGRYNPALTGHEPLGVQAWTHAAIRNSKIFQTFLHIQMMRKHGLLDEPVRFSYVGARLQQRELPARTAVPVPKEIQEQIDKLPRNQQNVLLPVWNVSQDAHFVPAQIQTSKALLQDHLKLGQKPEFLLPAIALAGLFGAVQRISAIFNMADVDVETSGLKEAYVAGCEKVLKEFGPKESLDVTKFNRVWRTYLDQAESAFQRGINKNENGNPKKPGDPVLFDWKAEILDAGLAATKAEMPDYLAHPALLKVWEQQYKD